MAVVTKVRRLVANPHRRAKRKKSNPSGHRRQMTAKQIKFFGTSRQKAALKRARRAAKPQKAKRRLHVKATVSNPRRKVRAIRRKAPAKRKRQTNPAILVTLGAVNPRRNAVATKRRKAKRASNPRRRRRNTTRVVVTAPRRRNVSRRRRRVNPLRHRNPAFGLRGAGMAKAVTAGLAGMAAAKFIPSLLPTSIVSTNIMRAVATGASAFAAQMIAKAVVKDPAISDAVLFGGLMQTGSVALNAFLPSLASSLGLSGIMDARWTIPENPLRTIAAPAPVTPANVGGLAMAYGRAY
jgi:hypothetical protein